MKQLSVFIKEGKEAKDKIILNKSHIDKIIDYLKSDITGKIKDQNYMTYLMDGDEYFSTEKFREDCAKLLKYLKSIAEPITTIPSENVNFIYISKSVDDKDFKGLDCLNFGKFDFRNSYEVNFHTHTGYSNRISVGCENISNYKYAFNEYRFKEGYVFLVDCDLIDKICPEYKDEIKSIIDKRITFAKSCKAEYDKFMKVMKDFTVSESQKKFLKDPLEKSLKSIKKCAVSDIKDIENISDKENWYVINLYPNKPHNKFEESIYNLIIFAENRKRDIPFKYYKFTGKRTNEYGYDYESEMFVVNWNDLLKTNISKSFFDYTFKEWYRMLYGSYGDYIHEEDFD